MENPKIKEQEKEELPMTKKEALDILLQKVAESKRQIARGEYYTLEEVRAMLDAKKNNNKA